MGLHFIALNWAKEIRSPKRRSISHETLDDDSRKCDSRSCDTDEKGFRNSVSGAFFFCGLLLVRGVSELVQQCRQALLEKPAKLHAGRLVQLQLDLMLRGSKLGDRDSLFIADRR